MLRLFCIFLFWLILATFSDASIVNISPTQLVLAPYDSITTLSLTNADQIPITMQIDIKRWTQNHGKDDYTDTNDLIATPMMFEIPPNKTQIIRFALQYPMNRDHEQAYRIYLKEVVPHIKIPALQKNNQVQIALNINLPFFISSKDFKIDYSWQLKQINNQLELSFTNNSTVTLLITDWHLFNKSKSMTENKNTFTYIQPNQQYSWVLEKNHFMDASTIISHINGQQKKDRVQMV